MPLKQSSLSHSSLWFYNPFYKQEEVDFLRYVKNNFHQGINNLNNLISHYATIKTVQSLQEISLLTLTTNENPTETPLSKEQHMPI